MKVAILASAAFIFANAAYAADIYSYSDAAPSTSVNSWTGFYLYGLAGYERASSHNVHLNQSSFGGPGGTFDHKGDGFIYGAAAGYNMQFDNGFVLGAEVGIRSARDIDDGNAYAQYNNFTDTSLKYLGTAKARLGMNAGQWMPYITAGVAHGKLSSRQLIASTPSQAWEGKKSETGYVLGGGADFKVNDQVFVGVEYNYTDLGKTTFSAPDPDQALFDTTNIQGHYKSHSVFGKIGYRF